MHANCAVCGAFMLDSVGQLWYMRYLCKDYPNRYVETARGSRRFIILCSEQACQSTYHINPLAYESKAQLFNVRKD